MSEPHGKPDDGQTKRGSTQLPPATSFSPPLIFLYRAYPAGFANSKPSPEVDDLSDEPVMLPTVSEEENLSAIPIQVFRTDLDMNDGSSTEEDDDEWRKEAVCSPRGGNTPVGCVPIQGVAPTEASFREATRRLSREITPDDPAKVMPKFCGSPILVASLRSVRF